jgi:ABC-type glucose/galactose transport system permease subunit
MPLRDPRPLAKALVAVLAVALLAQTLRVGFRVLAFRDAVATDDFLVDPQVQVGDTVDLREGSVVIAEGLLVILLLFPLQILAAVLWLLWQKRLRRNADLLPAGDPARVARRVLTVALVAIAVIAAEAALYAAGIAIDADPTWTKRLVGFELVLDLVVLALLAAVAFTTSRWTRDQDRLVRQGG